MSHGPEGAHAPITSGRGLMITGASTAAGAALGWVLAQALPTPADASGHPVIPFWLVIPFATLIGSIAVLPLAVPRFWHRHYQDVALGLGAVVAAYYLAALGMPAHGVTYGAYKLRHAVEEYAGFIALLASLYMVSGTIVIEVRGRAGPVLNTAMLAFGAVLANFVGTTGASMLLIRPFMNANEGRLRPLHVVFFIFIVSNCGGSVTPIGDPPLYLGYLVGVPFAWSIEHLWFHGLLVCAALLAIFFVFDARIPRPASPEPGATRVRVRGALGLVGLALLIGAIFAGPPLDRALELKSPISTPALQLLIGALCFALAPAANKADNRFSWHPIAEVAWLFAGIFATMMPALAYLAEHGGELGLTSPRAFYLATGSLSAVLDNAPTYLNFLQVAMAGQEMSAANVRAWLADPVHDEMLVGISTGAVFFGAMTYIGNGPNFMVRSIAEARGLAMPSFFGYAGLACLILLPVLLLHALIV